MINDVLHVSEEIPQIPAGTTPEDYEKQIVAIIQEYEPLEPSDLSKPDSIEKYLGKLEDTPDPSVEYLLLLYDCCRLSGYSSPDAPTAPTFYLPVDSLLWTKIAQYLGVFDPIAVRYTGWQWRCLAEILYQSTSHANMHAAAIDPLHSALSRLDPSGGTYTSLHILFVRAIMHSGIYNRALPIIDRLIHSFPSKRNHEFDGSLSCSYHKDSSAFITVLSGLTKPPDVREIQEYNLLCAMICLGIGQDKWEDALTYLEMVLVTPTQNVATGYMLEAYKKRILLCCLVHGKVSVNVPTDMNSNVSRALRNAAKPYDALVNAFSKSMQHENSSFIREEIEAGRQIWDNDGNLYLTLALAESIPIFWVKNLSLSYTSLPINLICASPLFTDFSKDQVIKFLQNLITSQALQAVIMVEPEPLLVFTPSSANVHSESDLQKLIFKEVSLVKIIQNGLRLADRKIMVSKEYVKYTIKSRDDERNEANRKSEIVMGSNPFVRIEEEENSMIIDESELGLGLGPGDDDVDEDLMQEL